MSTKNRKKFTLLLMCLFAFSLSRAAVKTTIADGDWFNPVNWSPVGVPLMEDTVLVNHNMTADGQMIELYASILTVNPGKSITSNNMIVFHCNMVIEGTILAPTYLDMDAESTVIYGELTADTITIGNEMTFNYGLIDASFCVTEQGFRNYGTLEVGSLIIPPGYLGFINHTAAILSVYDTCYVMTKFLNLDGANMDINYLFTMDSLTNDGQVTTVDWMHYAGLVNGNQGTFCVENCFSNFGEIDGDIDICDASPGEVCDVNFGTISGSVTFCAQSVCSNIGVGLEEEISLEGKIFPNPTHGLTSIRFDNALENAEISVLDMTGGTVIHESNVNGIEWQMDATELSAGLYMVNVVVDNHFNSYRLVVTDH